MPSFEAAIAADVMSTAAAPPVFAAGLISSHFIPRDESSSRHCEIRPCSKLFGQSLRTTAHELHCLAAKLSKHAQSNYQKKGKYINRIYSALQSTVVQFHGMPSQICRDFRRSAALLSITGMVRQCQTTCVCVCVCVCSKAVDQTYESITRL